MSLVLDDYYWDGTTFRKKDTSLSNLLLGLNALHKITSSQTAPASPLANLLRNRILSYKETNMWEKFNVFLSKIELTPLQRQDAITKTKNIAGILHGAYYSLLYGVGTTHAIVGSYLKGTVISPPSDIDILFVLPQKDFSRFGQYVMNPQSALLQEIRRKLLQSFPRTEIKADGQAILVPFSSYSVEVVPCFKHTNGVFVTPDANDGGKWKISNPNAERALLQTSNLRSAGNTIKLIKMIKAWKNYCSVDIKSLVIELRSIYFLEKWQYYNKGSVYYDWMLRDFFSELIRFNNGTCSIPGIGEKISYGDIWKSKAESVFARASKACEYESSKNIELASQEWKKIFGDRFS